VHRGTQASAQSPTPFAYGALPLSGVPFQGTSARDRVCYSVGRLGPPPAPPPTPGGHRPPGHSALRVWAQPRSLATTRGLAFAFSSSGY
jgi:hypothetical protein